VIMLLLPSSERSSHQMDLQKKSSQRNTPAVVYPFMNSYCSLSFVLYSVFCVPFLNLYPERRKITYSIYTSDIYLSMFFYSRGMSAWLAARGNKKHRPHSSHVCKNSAFSAPSGTRTLDK